MKEKDTLKAAIFVLIGFILGYAAHAYVSATPTVEAPVVVEEQEVVVAEDESEALVTTSEKVPVETEEATPYRSIPNNLSMGGYVVSVSDQSSGSIVYLSQLEIPEEAWVAVREDRDGDLGNILGARKYPAGESTGVVELIRGTAAGSVYYVVFYSDDGDGAFDHKKDHILMDDEEKVIAAKFRTY